MDNFFPGIYCGIIVFQTAIIAPILATALAGDVFSAVVRTIWPRFFLTLVITGCCSLLTDIVSNSTSNVRISVIVLTIISRFQPFRLPGLTITLGKQQASVLLELGGRTPISY